MNQHFNNTSKEQSLETWTSLLRQSCGKYETILASDAEFMGRVKILSHDEITISHIQTNAHRLTKHQLDSSDNNEENLFLVLQIGGKSRFKQCGSEVILNDGDITIMDQRYACELQLLNQPQHLSFQIPTTMAQRVLGTKTLTPTSKLTTRTGLPLTLRRYIENSFHSLANKDELSLAVKQEIAIKLVADCINFDKDFLSRTDYQHIRLNEVKSYIQRNITNHELTIESIALANCLSRRQFFRLFQRVNTTPSKWMKVQRLAYAKQSLLSPAFKNRPISELASHCGFSDLAYFTRSFTEVYRHPPARYRSLTQTNH